MLAFCTVVWLADAGLHSLRWFGSGRLVWHQGGLAEDDREPLCGMGVLGVVLGVVKRKHALELRCDMFSVC